MTILVASMLHFAPAFPEDPGIDGRLRSGEIVASETDSDGIGASGRMQLLIRAPARAVWDVIISCDLAYVFVDGLEHCEVLEDSGERALVHQVVNQSWLIPTYDYTFESLRQPYQRIDVRLVEGNLRVLEGYWAFRETAEGTVVDYQIRIQPSLPAPRFIVRRNMARSMPDMLACIRGLAGGSGTSGLTQRDLGRCPGSVRSIPTDQ